MHIFYVSLLTEKSSPLEEKYTWMERKEAQRTVVCWFVSKDKRKPVENVGDLEGNDLCLNVTRCLLATV